MIAKDDESFLFQQRIMLNEMTFEYLTYEDDGSNIIGFIPIKIAPQTYKTPKMFYNGEYYGTLLNDTGKAPLLLLDFMEGRRVGVALAEFIKNGGIIELICDSNGYWALVNEAT